MSTDTTTYTDSHLQALLAEDALLGAFPSGDLPPDTRAALLATLDALRDFRRLAFRDFMAQFPAA